MKLSSGMKNIVRIPAYTLCGPVLYDKLQFLRANHYWPDYKNPRTFNERMGHYKLYNPPANAAMLSDKCAVRDYVKARVGADILNDVYYAGADLENIPWDMLPKRFFAKGTHGSGKDFMIRVEDKEQFTLAEFRQRAGKILKMPFGRLSNERWYENIRPQIIIEKYLGDRQYLVAPDYKFLTFHGKVRAIGVIVGRFADPRSTFFDENWKRADYSLKFQPGPDIKRPENLAKMIDVAEKLAAGLEFVRVDLYNVGGNQIVFGEMTLCYGAGWDPVKPDRSYDRMLGSYWSGDSSSGRISSIKTAA